MCEEVVLNNYMAFKELGDLIKLCPNKKLDEEEVISYLMPITYNDEVNAKWLSGGVKDVKGLVNVIFDILER